MIRRRCLVWAAAVCTAIALAPAAPARAQQPTPPPGAFLLPQETLKGIKHHASFMLSGGFDLDVIGNVVEGALGQQGSTQIAVTQSLPWPDVYVAVPKRVEFVAGFGIFQKDEIIGRVSRTTYTADPVEKAGNYAGPGQAGDVTLNATPYRERSWEIGWRHYMVVKPRAKQYVNIVYGVRTVDPISVDFRAAEPVGHLGTLRAYGQSRPKTFGLELGLTFEAGHVGVFAQVGARFVQRLQQQDDELAGWKLEAVNDTGTRFYMPLQFGLLLRL